jgi:hypothetical protein
LLNGAQHLIKAKRLEAKPKNDGQIIKGSQN